MKQRAFDALVVGAGAAGLRAALELARAGRSVAVLCKEHALRAPTVGAWDGISAALADGDDWRAHLADTLHAGGALCDQNAAELMCAQAPRVVRELERWGMPFERGADGAPAQEVGSGHGANGDTVRRVCTAGERTGYAVLHTLWQQCLAAECEFLHEWLALELLFTDAGEAAGVMALELASGAPYVLRAHAVLLAGGGGARAFAGSGAAFGSTGDALGMAARAGIPLQDMEFWQFSPLALAGSGVLLGERCLAAGVTLLGGDGEPFMQRHAPQRGELAGADVVARAAALEIAAGNGCGPRRDYVLLDLAPLGAGMLRQRLP
ncbi:MAG: FAD-binding protein, partial [Ottowia sp.]|nr:FAD-binding protein [Ottowia sp.]